MYCNKKYIFNELLSTSSLVLLSVQLLYGDLWPRNTQSTQSRGLSSENQSLSRLLLAVVMLLHKSFPEATLSLLILGRVGVGSDDPCQDVELLLTLQEFHSGKRCLEDKELCLCVWWWLGGLGLSLGKGSSGCVDLECWVCVWVLFGFVMECLSSSSCSLAKVSAAVSSSLSSHSRLTVSSRKDFYMAKRGGKKWRDRMRQYYYIISLTDQYNPNTPKLDNISLSNSPQGDHGWSKPPVTWQFL